MAFNASLWGQQATHTINVGQVPSSQSNVPILITKNLASFPSSMLDAGSTSALNGGGDIRVSTDAAGANQLPVEIVSCVTSATPANQELIMWVKVPTVNDSEVIYITWNRAAQTQPPVTDTFGRNAVWSDFLFASHDMITDVTGNGTITESGTPSAATGPFGGNARDYDGANDYASLSNSTSLAGAISVIAWFEYDNDNFPRLLTASDSGNNGLGVSLHDTENDVYIFASDNDAGSTWGNLTQTRRNAQLVAGWQFVGASASATDGGGDKTITATLYNNSSMLTTGSESWFKPDASEFNIANRGAGNSKYDGRLGGLCGFYNGAITQDGLQAYYNNQSDQNAWATIGTPYVPGGVATTVDITETFPSPTESVNVSITITSQITETFPAPVENITATATFTVTSDITETFPAPTENISAFAGGLVTNQITEVFPTLQEAINVNVKSTITTQVTESFPAAIENVSILIPGEVVFNGKKIRRVNAINKRARINARRTIKRVN